MTADHDADTVTVVFDPSKISPEQLAAAIENWPLMRVTGSKTHELDRNEIRSHRRVLVLFHGSITEETWDEAEF